MRKYTDELKDVKVFPAKKWPRSVYPDHNLPNRHRQGVAGIEGSGDYPQ